MREVGDVGERGGEGDGNGPDESDEIAGTERETWKLRERKRERETKIEVYEREREKI